MRTQQYTLWGGYHIIVLLLLLPPITAKTQVGNFNITNISPSPACSGDTLLIEGSGFMPPNQSNPSVNIGGQIVRVLAYTNTTISTEPPPPHITGITTVTVSLGNQSQSTIVNIISAYFSLDTIYCENYGDTAYANNVNGPGTFSLPTGFISAGAPLVGIGLVSQHPIIDIGASGGASGYVTFSLDSTGNGCLDTHRVWVEVKAPRVIDSLIKFPDTLICISDTVQSLLSPLIQGDYIFSPTIGIVIDSSGMIFPDSSTPGTYNLQAVAVNPVCRDTAFFQRIVIESDYQPTLSYDSVYCKSQQVNTTNLGMPPGGQYIGGGGGVVDSQGQIDFANSTSNQPLTISYDLNGNRCSTAVHDTVRIVELQAAFSYVKDSLCDSNSPLPLDSFSLSGGTQGYFYSNPPNNPGLNTQTGTFDPSLSPLGNFDINYHYSYGPNSLCPDNFPSSNNPLIIYPSPDPSFIYPNDTLCTNSSGNQLTPILTTPGGTFSVVNGNCLVDSVSGVIDIANSDSGQCEIKYELTGECPRADTFVLEIVKFRADFYYPNDSLCNQNGQELPIEISISPPGGIYSYTGAGNLAIDPASGAIDPSASSLGTFFVTYTITSGICSETFQAYSPVTINAPTVSPYPNFSYIPNYACPSTLFLDIGQIAVPGEFFVVDSGNCMVDSLTGRIDVAASQPGECIIRREFPGSCYHPDRDTVVIYYAKFHYPEDTLCTLVDTLGVIWDTLVGGPGIFVANLNGLAINSLTGTIYPDSSQISTYVVEYQFIQGGCPGGFPSQNPVTIESPPNPTFSYSPIICPGDSNPLPNITSPGGIFSVLSGNCVVDSSTGSILLDSSIAGTCYIIHEIPGECSVMDTFSVEILDFEYVFDYADDSICILDSILIPQVSASSGQSVSFPAINGLAINALTGAIDPALSQPGTYLIKAILTDPTTGCTETIPALDSIKIYPPLNPAFAYPNLNICPNSSNPLPTGVNITHPEDSFFVSQGGCVIDTFTGEILLAQSDTGLCTIARSFPGDCYVDSIVTVHIFEFDAQISYQKDSVCLLEGIQSPLLTTSGQTPNFISLPPGLAINDSTGAVDPGNSSLGTYAIQLTLSAAGCQEFFLANDSLEIYEPLDPTVNYPDSLCPQGPSLAPIVVDTGGIFSVVNGGCQVDPLTGVIDYANSLSGPCVIEYAHGDSCPVAARDTINIYRFAAQFDYLDNVICNLDTPIVPLFTTQSNSGSFYSVPSLGNSLNPVTGTLAPDSNNVGTYSIHYTIDSGGCRDTFVVDTMVQIYLSPDPGFLYDPLICPDDSNFIVPIVNESGGIFSVIQGGCVVDSVTGVIDIDSSAIGLCSIRYEFPGDCPIADSFTVDIYRFSSNLYYPDDSVCILDAKLYPDSNASNSGTFFAVPPLPNGTLHPDSGWVVPSINVVGTYEINYRIDSGGCQDTFLVDPSLVLYEPFDPTISYAPHVCLDSMNPMPSIVDSGGTFKVLPGPGTCILDSTTGEIDLSSSSAGVYTIEYSFEGDCPVSDSAMIEIHDSLQTSFFYSQDTFCALPDTIQPILSSNFINGFSFNVIQGPILAMNASNGTIVLDTQTPDSLYVIEYGASSPFMCPQFSRDTFRILEGDNPMFEYELPSYCDSMLVALPLLNTLPASLGYYLGDSGLVWADSLQGHIDLTQSSLGLHTIIFIPTGGIYCPGSKTATINIVAYDTAVTFAYPQDTFCFQGGLVHPLINGDSSGFYSGDSIWLDPGTGVVNLDLTPVGDHQVEYHLTGVCQEVLSYGFHVEPREDASFSFAKEDYCPNEADPYPISDSIATPGGIFSGINGLIIDSLTGKIDLANSSNRLHSVSYTTPGRCPSTNSIPLNIYDDVSPLFWDREPDSYICQGELLCIETDFTDTIHYQLNGSTEASNVSVHCFEGLINGDIISLIHSNDTNCLDTVFVPVTVHPVPTLDTNIAIPIQFSGTQLNLPLEGDPPFMQAQWLAETNQGSSISPDSGTIDFDSDGLAELVAALSSPNLHFPSYIDLVFNPITDFCQGDQVITRVLINPVDVQIFIPEVFTPNNDGLNDTWKVQWTSEINPDDFSLELFNRSYGRVLEMRPLSQDWDGKNLPDGVYRWVLRGKGGEVLRVGGLTIRRR